MNKWLRASAFLTLLALALMVWSVLQPTPLPVMLSMSVGQGIGTLAFGLYGWVVLADLRRLRKNAKKGAELAHHAAEVADIAGALTATASAALAAVEQANLVADPTNGPGPVAPSDGGTPASGPPETKS